MILEKLKKNEGHLFRYIRLKKKMSQKQLSEKLNIQHSTLCRIEKGERRPTLEQKRKLARMMKTPFIKMRDQFYELIEVKNYRKSMIY